MQRGEKSMFNAVNEAIKEERFTTKEIALSAAFSAVVFVLTSIIAMPVASTQGFFNIGEIGVYLAALIGGPYVGAIAGAVGSSLADIALGYGLYAPGTFVIKGTEGFVAGLLFKLYREESQNLRYLVLGIMGLAFGILGAFTIFDGNAEMTGYLTIFSGLNLDSLLKGDFISLEGSNPIVTYNSIAYPVPDWFIIILLLILLGLVIIAEFFLEETGKMLTSCVVAGSIMILGYAAYQFFILGFGVAAITEIPVNVAQAAIGTSVTIPVITYLKRMGVLEE